MGVKCSQEVATAICRALLLARLFVVPVQWGSWGSKVRKPHAVPCKVTRHCGSVLVCLIPVSRDTGIISVPVPRSYWWWLNWPLLHLHPAITAIRGSFAKATFNAISKTYSYLTPDLWKESVFTESLSEPPYQEFTDLLVKTHSRVSVQRTQAPAVAIT